METCKQCAAQVAEDDNFCFNCGVPLQETLVTQKDKELKKYEQALTRLEKRMDLPKKYQASSSEGRYLFWTGLTLSGFWIINQLVAFSVPGGLLTKIYAVLLILEAALPLAVSFFIQNRFYRNILQVVGGAMFLFFLARMLFF